MGANEASVITASSENLLAMRGEPCVRRSAFRTSFYYRDPDGNMVELQIDNMAPDLATQYLRGEEYSSDPLGPSFDPDAMIAALKAGTPESQLTTRSWAMTCPQLNVAELLLT
jgi:hypothetical protein